MKGGEGGGGKGKISVAKIKVNKMGPIPGALSQLGTRKQEQ